MTKSKIIVNHPENTQYEVFGHAEFNGDSAELRCATGIAQSG